MTASAEAYVQKARAERTAVRLNVGSLILSIATRLRLERWRIKTQRRRVAKEVDPVLYWRIFFNPPLSHVSIARKGCRRCAVTDVIVVDAKGLPRG